MMLSTHALAGAAVSVFFPEQASLAFAAGFASHFLLDAIPHKDYDLRSFVKNESDPLRADFSVKLGFLHDLAKISVDAILGCAAALAIFLPFGQVSIWVLGAGIVGGLLPDFLQFVFMTTGIRVLRPLQIFHRFIHTKNSLEASPVYAVAAQAAFSATFIALILLISL